MKNNMTPKEQAKEIVDGFIPLTMNWNDGTGEWIENKFDAIQCGLITVNRIISANPHSNPFNTTVYSTMGYWCEVKKEIENL